MSRGRGAQPKNAPTVVTPPVIAGEPTVGQTLACDDGTWDQTPDSVAHQWRRDDVDIGGAVAATYMLGAIDEGAMISCMVTATNVDGSDTAASNEVGPVAAAAKPPDVGDGERAEMRTIAEEQRARSAVIQTMGVDDWKDAHDDRPPDQRQNRQVPGVGPSAISERVAPPPEGGSWAGSTRSTPPARKAQNRSAP